MCAIINHRSTRQGEFFPEHIMKTKLFLSTVVYVLLMLIFCLSISALTWDFKTQKQMDDWEVINGEWEIKDGKLLGTQQKTYIGVVAGDVNWKDYLLKVKWEKTVGPYTYLMVRLQKDPLSYYTIEIHIEVGEPPIASDSVWSTSKRQEGERKEGGRQKKKNNSELRIPNSESQRQGGKRAFHVLRFTLPLIMCPDSIGTHNNSSTLNKNIRNNSNSHFASLSFQSKSRTSFHCHWLF